MMLNNFIIALEAVAPMFIIMLVGFLARAKGLVDEGQAKYLNKLVFAVFFPPLMFTNLYGADLENAFNFKLLAFSAGMVVAGFVLSCIFVTRVEKSPRSRGALIQAIYRSNFVIMGMPIVANIYGEESLTSTACCITIVVPLYNILAVCVLEYFRGEKPNPKAILKGIVKNPLIIGAVLGVVAVVIKLQLPEVIESALFSIKDVVTPLAVFALGASLNRKSVDNCKRNLVFAVAGRLLVIPAIALTIGVLVGFRGVDLVTLIAIFASPAAVSSYPMAQQMDSDAELAANSVVFTSAFACFTMFTWIFMFKNFGLF